MLKLTKNEAKQASYQEILCLRLMNLKARYIMIGKDFFVYKTRVLVL